MPPHSDAFPATIQGGIGGVPFILADHRAISINEFAREMLLVVDVPTSWLLP